MARKKEEKQAENVVEEKVEEKVIEQEVTFIPPHDVYRVKQRGTVVKNEDNLHVILRGEDGANYAIVYVHAVHKDLKAGDELDF